MIIGYARVSTEQQKLDPQADALTAAGAERIHADTITGTKRILPQRPTAPRPAPPCPALTPLNLPIPNPPKNPYPNLNELPFILPHEWLNPPYHA